LKWAWHGGIVVAITEQVNIETSSVALLQVIGFVVGLLLITSSYPMSGEKAASYVRREA
jgi:hypothetical protein